ncbi:MAG TPA: patatin-like phospholipase family protein [Allosphingosinicella sp.]|jgi:hypothetical protein
MPKTRIFASFLLMGSLAGCAGLGMKSVPWPTSTEVHDVQAVDFLRSAPAVDAGLGGNLFMKEMFDDGRLVGLSVSGGGARAAAFTLGVLTELQAIGQGGSNMLDRIDFISSNSGGSWGVAAYLADRAASRDAGYKLLDRMQLPKGNSLIDRFDRMSDGTVKCWSSAMREHLFGERTYGDIYSSANPVPLPRVFINAALLPSHSPFVFSDAFLRHYRVERFGACGDHWLTEEGSPPVRNVADLQFGYAAAASGTVSPFYHAFASTGLCAGDSPAREASFCHSILKGKPRSYLRIADGGYYDNIGYKTAYEVMLGLNGESPEARRAMIFVNSNTATDLQMIAPAKRSSSFLITTAGNGLMAVQDSTFERLYKPMFGSVRVKEPVLLDFYSTARFRPDQAHLLSDLRELAFYAANNVACFNGERFVEPKRRRSPLEPPPAQESVAKLAGKGGDCLSENFYRAGTLAKTTYKIDSTLFTILWQLGRLSVRMNCRGIVGGVEGQSGGPGCRRYDAG